KAAGGRRSGAAAMERDERGRFVGAARRDGPEERAEGTRGAPKAAASTGSGGPSRGARKAMATPVKMPEIGEPVPEGTITRWLKQEGDRVEADEPLFRTPPAKVEPQ